MKRWIESRSWARLVLMLGVLLALALGAVACGSDDGGNTSASGNGDGTEVTAGEMDYEAMLAKLYEGDYRDPAGPVLSKPAPGKKIWVVSTTLNTEANTNVVAGVEEAAAKLDWAVTIFDAKYEPTRMLSGVQQAVAAGADGIITVYVDCPTIKNGLVQAEQAGIPTINVDGGECPSPGFTETIQYPNFATYEEYIKAFGAAQAEYAIAKTEGSAKVIMNTETDLAATRAQSEGAYETLESCSGCEIVGDAKFVGADFGPPLQSKISQQLVQHPDANVFIAAYDAALTSGGAQAIKASGRLNDILVVGGEGSVAGIELIRDDGGMDACIGYVPNMQGFAAVNYLAVIFGDESTAGVNNGIGLQACDKEHNLPPVGEEYQSPVDYKAVYDELWSIE